MAGGVPHRPVPPDQRPVPERPAVAHRPAHPRHHPHRCRLRHRLHRQVASGRQPPCRLHPARPAAPGVSAALSGALSRRVDRGAPQLPRSGARRPGGLLRPRHRPGPATRPPRSRPASRGPAGGHHLRLHLRPRRHARLPGGEPQAAPLGRVDPGAVPAALPGPGGSRPPPLGAPQRGRHPAHPAGACGGDDSGHRRGPRPLPRHPRRAVHRQRIRPHHVHRPVRGVPRRPLARPARRTLQLHPLAGRPRPALRHRRRPGSAPQPLRRPRSPPPQAPPGRDPAAASGRARRPLPPGPRLPAAVRLRRR